MINAAIERGNFYLKELLGMQILNFVNFENLLHMKLYSLMILNKIQKQQKENGKALKTTKLVLFPGRIYCHVNKTALNTQHLRRHDQTWLHQ